MRFYRINLKLILVMDGWGIAREIALRIMQLGLTDKSTLCQRCIFIVHLHEKYFKYLSSLL